jgi:uncharacterized membrane protein
MDTNIHPFKLPSHQQSQNKNVHTSSASRPRGCRMRAPCARTIKVDEALDALVAEVDADKAAAEAAKRGGGGAGGPSGGGGGAAAGGSSS